MDKWLNLSTLEQLKEDIGTGIIETLIDSFHTEANKHIKVITAISEAELEPGFLSDVGKNLNFHAHSLKGMAHSLGCKTLGEVSAWLETNSKSEQNATPEFIEKFSEIKRALPRVFEQSYQALNQWNKTNA